MLQVSKLNDGSTIYYMSDECVFSKRENEEVTK